MPYAEGRTYHDAASHVKEIDDWLPQHAEPGVRDQGDDLDLVVGDQRAVNRAMADMLGAALVGR